MKNLIERSMIMTNNSTLRIELKQISESGRSKSKTIDEIQKDHIISVLERTKWKINGKSGHAEKNKIEHTT